MKRRLTVSCTHPVSRVRFLRRPSDPMPLLRLKGRWLDRAGFAIGACVRVRVAPGLISLEVLDTPNDHDA